MDKLYLTEGFCQIGMTGRAGRRRGNTGEGGVLSSRCKLDSCFQGRVCVWVIGIWIMEVYEEMVTGGSVLYQSHPPRTTLSS